MRSYRESSDHSGRDDAASAQGAGKQTRSQSIGVDGHPGPAAAPSVGKHTLTESVQRKIVQRRASEDAPMDAASVTNTAAAGVNGGGGDVPHRAALESGFGVDLSDVRAHTGAPAAQASRAIGAEAYTYGSDIAFTSSSPSKDLVAHEVAHVIQQ